MELFENIKIEFDYNIEHILDDLQKNSWIFYR